MDLIRPVLRYRHYACCTEQTYCDWILRYIRYHGNKTHHRNMGKKEIEGFLSHLVVQQKVASTTQSQVLNAIVFLYKIFMVPSPLETLTMMYPNFTAFCVSSAR